MAGTAAKRPRKKAASEKTVGPIAQHMRRVMDRASRSPLTRLLALRLKNAGHRLEVRTRGDFNFRRTEMSEALKHEAVNRLVALDGNRGQSPGAVADKVCDCLLLLLLAEGRHTQRRAKTSVRKPTATADDKNRTQKLDPSGEAETA